MKKIFFAFAAVLFVAFLANEDADAKKYDALRLYSVKELREDLAFLKHKLEKRNPCLYVYSSQQQLDSAFNAIDSAITVPMTDMDFYKLIGQLNPLIRDGHTGANLPSKAWKVYFGNDSTYIPLNIVSIGDHLYSTMNLGPDTVMDAGAEILSIDGRSSAEIIAALIRNHQHDGNIETGARHVLSGNFLASYSKDIGKPAGYEIKYQQPDSTIQTHYFKAQPGDTLVKYFKERTKTKSKTAVAKRGIRLSFDSASGTATLSIPSFDPRTLRKYYHQNFHHQVVRSFRLIREKKVQHLILDLRGNGGGDMRCAKFLLRHLLDTSFTIIEKCFVVKKDDYRDTAKRIVSHWLPDAGLGEHDPVKDVFTGKLFVLIDGGTFSASCCVSSCLRVYGRAIFIGEESGGQQYRSGGYEVRNSFTLPNTKIKFYTSNVMSVIRTASPDTGRGIIPDYSVSPTIFNYLRKSDTVMNYTRALIKQGK
ncbi:MAG TPA: S41 family peptidase [Bacteroidia bacterium]|nr:S41 family peptidase [Bacteroidia bacterium]